MARRPQDRERGQTTPLLALVVVVVGFAALVAVTAGRAADDRARARTAADAAALAGAAEGRHAATHMAEANGGALVGYVELGSIVEVRVTYGNAIATARAKATTQWVTS